MNAEKERLLSRLEYLQDSYDNLCNTIHKQHEMIKRLIQENEDLKEQLRQWGIDSAKFADIRKKNSPDNLKGLFLK